MKLKEFIENLNELVKERPECLEYAAVTSKDAEGNGYSLVHFTPQVGNLDEYNEFSEERVANAVCIN